MKVKIINYREPKTRKSALNLAVHISKQLDIWRSKEENLMNNRISVSEKIQRLQKTLEELNTQIESCQTGTLEWEQELQKLKTRFAITEAEILELKSSQLRSLISQLEIDLELTKLDDENI